MDDEKAILDKQLKESVDALRHKAINIKGKSYVLVSDRVLFFNQTYPKGSILTELVSPVDAETVIIKATVSPEPDRMFTGYSQAKWGDGYINKTSALENAETSAVGRALAFMGIGVLDSIASVDEINKAERRTSAEQEEFAQKKIAELKAKFKAQAPAKPPMEKAGEIIKKQLTGVITPAQQKRMFAIASQHGVPKETLRDLLGRYGFEHSNEVTIGQYDTIIADIESVVAK